MSGNASILQMEFEAHLIRQRKAFSQTQKAGIKKSPLARVYHALPMKLRNLGAISRMKERYVKQAYADAPDFTRLCMMSFVNYLLNSEEGAVERHAKLLCDDESRAVMHDALGHYVRCSFGGVPGAADLYGQELYSKIRKVGDNFEFMGATMPQNTFSPEAFLNHHGLVFLPGSVTGRLQGKDVIDLGAHIGDSALVLSKYNGPAGKIFSFEIEKRLCEEMKLTAKMNGLEGRLLPINEGVGEATGEIAIDCFPRDYYFHHPQEKELSLRTVSLDGFFEGKELDLGLIKMDIEGFEYDAIKGASKLISKFKPIILASVYHTGTEFFEIPPLLRKLNPDYRFKLAMTNQQHPNKELELIAF